MNKSKDDILKETDVHVVFVWMKENPLLADKEVCDYFNKLRLEGYQNWCCEEGLDPDIHWDFTPQKSK
ncbi:MAG: hypothetical protein RR900_05770 [Ruthenibacterium sp.]